MPDFDTCLLLDKFQIYFDYLVTSNFFFIF